ncbi:MAG: dTMP kinase [bacterium]
MLITFEGIEGAGKTTQINLLCRELEKRGISFINIREPGGTPFSEQIRHILLSKSFSAGSIAELLLFEASRAELVKDVIIPAITEKKIVICDRFTDSTIAYQGYGRGLPIKVIKRLNEFVTAGVSIRRTYLLDSSLKVMEKRSAERIKDRIENEDIDFHKRVKRGFLSIARNNPERVLVIDATKDVEEIHKIIKDDFFRLL